MITPVTEPRRGDPVAADTIAQIIRNTQANRITHGSGYTFTRGPGGTSLTIDRPEPAPGPEAPERLAVPCRTTGEGSVLDGFEVEVYGDGITRPYTHKDTMYILEIHAGAQIPANMWFLADVSVSQYLGGTN